MNIALVIDELNSGGAQRQMCILAGLLVKQGHAVKLFKYHRNDFFRPLLEEAGVEIQEIVGQGLWGRSRELRTALQAFGCDVAIAFLSAPSFYLELASLPRRSFGLIVSERSGRIGKITWRDRLVLNCHRLADVLVTNTHSMKDFAEANVPALRRKTRVIVNCVDTEYFQPVEEKRENAATRFVVPARVSSAKNALGLARAVEHVRQIRPDINFVIEWHGDNYFKDRIPTKSSKLYLEVKEYVKQLELQDVFQLKPAVRDLRSVYLLADAMILPSFFEGCSNAICEALSCGLPVLTSDVCDNSVFVQDGKSGMLFDPLDHLSIAEAIVRFCETNSAERAAMGVVGRAYAVEQFSQSRFLKEYSALIHEVNENRGARS